MLCGILERFGGYTLTTLEAESAEILQLLAIEAAGGERDVGQFSH